MSQRKSLTDTLSAATLFWRVKEISSMGVGCPVLVGLGVSS